MVKVVVIVVVKVVVIVMVGHTVGSISSRTLAYYCYALRLLRWTFTYIGGQSRTSASVAAGLMYTDCVLDSDDMHVSLILKAV